MRFYTVQHQHFCGIGLHARTPVSPTYTSSLSGRARSRRPRKPVPRAPRGVLGQIAWQRGRFPVNGIENGGRVSISVWCRVQLGPRPWPLKSSPGPETGLSSTVAGVENRRSQDPFVLLIPGA